MTGKFFQVAEKGLEDVRFFSVDQSNLRPEADHIPNDYEKTVFPNYILLEMIKEAGILNIKISRVDFFQAISLEFSEDMDELLDARKYYEIVQKIEENDLDIKSMVIFDSDRNKIQLYSSGIVWIENEENSIQLISSFLEKAKT